MSKQTISKAQFVELSKAMDPVDIIRKYTVLDLPFAQDKASILETKPEPEALQIAAENSIPANTLTQDVPQKVTAINSEDNTDNQTQNFAPDLSSEPVSNKVYCQDCGQALTDGKCTKCQPKVTKTKTIINWSQLSHNLQNSLLNIVALFRQIKLPSFNLLKLSLPKLTVPNISLHKININPKQLIKPVGALIILTLCWFGFQYVSAANSVNNQNLAAVTSSVSSANTNSSSIQSVVSQTVAPDNQKELTDTKKQLEDNNKKLEENKKEIDAKNGEIENLKKQLSNNTNSGAVNYRLEGEKTELQNKVNELQKNVENLQKLNKDLGNTSGANAALTTQVDQLNQQIEAKNKEIDAKNQTINNQNITIDNKNKDYQTLANTNNDLSNKYNSRNNDYNNLQQQNQSLTQNYNNLLSRPPVQCTIEYTTNAAGVRTKTSSNC
jgi:hypothetical protein